MREDKNLDKSAIFQR